jgi:hypothetical protein
MFKSIPGNYNFIISLNREIRNSDGSNATLLKRIEDKVEIELYGVKRTVDLEWLSLITFYEFILLDGFENRIGDIEFRSINCSVTNSQTGKVMVFKKPFLLKSGFRIIPGFSNYCINNKGVVKEIKSDCEIKPDYSRQYPSVYIYNPEFSRFKAMSVHRLVALAWIENESFLDRPIVNHIDGNKQNFVYTNLEWCSFSENNSHAFKTGLRTDNRPCKVKDCVTNTVTIYESFRQVCTAIGLTQCTKFRNTLYKRKPSILKNRYEIKLLEDKTPWLSDTNRSIKKGMYQTDVEYADGSVETFHDTRDIMKKLKIWNVSCNIKNIIEKAKLIYPGIKFTVAKNYEVIPVQAMCVQTGVVTNAKSVREISRILKIDFAKILNVLKQKLNRIVDGYVFRYESDLPWNTNFQTYISAKKTILAENKITGEIVRLGSYRQAAAFFKIDRSVIRRCLATNASLNDWVFKD